MIITSFVTYFYISSILNEPDLILSMSSYIEHMNPYGFPFKVTAMMFVCKVTWFKDEEDSLQ